MSKRIKTPSISPIKGRIDTLVNELCPEGVEYVKLGKLCTFVRGKTITEKDTIEGNIPVIAGGQKPSYFHNEHNKDGESITVAGSGAYAGFVSFWNVPIWVSDAFTVEPNDKAITKYVYYFLLTKQQRIFETQKGAGVPHVHGKDIANFEIPLPPLSIQQKIVSVLDSFTTLIDKMKQEVEKRKKQMEYYREKLLTFKDGECEWKTLIEATTISRGKRVVRKDLLESGSIPVYQNSLKPLGFANESNYPANTPFIISAGAAGEVGYSHTEYWGADDCFSILSGNSNSKFIYYWLKIKEPFLQSRIRGGAIKRLSRDIVENLPIPIIPINRQREIVSILDKFESYITKLEKMIALRQKQYEYYREQLLTFE